MDRMQRRRERAGLNKSEEQELKEKNESLKRHMQNAQTMQRQFQNDPNAYSMACGNYSWHKSQYEANKKRLEETQQSKNNPQNK